MDDGALDTEIDLTPEGCLSQDQTTFFNLAHAAIKYDFESEERFSFGASAPFNTLSTEKLQEVVASAKKTCKWQSSIEGEALRDESFKDWMFSRPLALRPIYWEISCNAYTKFKKEYEDEMNTEIFWVRRYQIAD